MCSVICESTEILKELGKIHASLPHMSLKCKLSSTIVRDILDTIQSESIHIQHVRVHLLTSAHAHVTHTIYVYNLPVLHIHYVHLSPLNCSSYNNAYLGYNHKLNYS